MITVARMKSCVLLLALAALVAAEAAAGLQEPMLFYHSAAGMAEAARIRQHEAALDFDGSRITGGQSVNAGAHPHLGGLVITLTNGQQSVCGSSMLTNNRAVTAAHCWWDGQNQARQFTVVYGSNRLFSGGFRITTSNILMHASYNFRTLHNDVAIIVHQWVAFGTTINRIALPSGTQLNNNFAGQTATAAGYGRTGDNAAIGQNQDKRQVSMPVITNAACASTFGSSTVIASTLCTSGAGARSVCPGDSGGPLSVGSGTGRILIGITSFVASAGCARGFPAGFARVTSFNSWILQRL
ncbi:collagenase-like [Ostrinia furnacalis]|uniref:collagenase-like n=1 Tax=Ostrinia furnacalis TaxID=93504 RepID=UPI001039B57E|nr:collagenase-like [Ostrinia furnacalis]